MSLLMKQKLPNGVLDLFDNLFNDDLFTLDLVNTSEPDYDIIENDDNYSLDLILPGFNKKDVSINVENNTLTIKGERKLDENLKFNRKGSFFGKINKVFTLPDNIEENKIDASFENGILSLTIPKISKTKLSKSIEIK